MVLGGDEVGAAKCSNGLAVDGASCEVLSVGVVGAVARLGLSELVVGGEGFQRGHAGGEVAGLGDGGEGVFVAVPSLFGWTERDQGSQGQLPQEVASRVGTGGCLLRGWRAVLPVVALGCSAPTG